MTDKGTGALTYSAAGSAVFFGLTANELAAYAATLVAICTFLMSWYFKHQHLKLAKATMENQQIPKVCRGCPHAPHIFKDDE